MSLLSARRVETLENETNRMADDSIAFKAARGVGWVFAWRMITRLLGMASTLVLVRVLQPSDFGLIALAVAFAGSIEALSSIGAEYALIREKEPDRALYDTAFTLNLLRGATTVLMTPRVGEARGGNFIGGPGGGMGGGATMAGGGDGSEVTGEESNPGAGTATAA